MASGELSYLGPQWRRDIAFAGNNVPMQGDIGAGQMLFGVEGVDPARRDRCTWLRGWLVHRLCPAVAAGRVVPKAVVAGLHC